MCILPPKRGNQKIEFDLPARIGASNLQEIFNLHEKMRQELNISIWEESFDQNIAQCKISPGRSVLKIHFFIESGLKMNQFKIQFKTKSGIFIQKLFIQ